MKIKFLYGTETGNAEMICEDIEADLGSGFDCDIASMGDVEPGDLDRDVFHIFVTSTYGNGDLPSTAQPFGEALDPEQVDLSGLQFAIFGLGDMVFSGTFNHGSQQLMDKLIACKAKMIGERGIHDASSADMPEDIAVPWAHEIIALFNAKAA